MARKMNMDLPAGYNGSALPPGRQLDSMAVYRQRGGKSSDYRLDHLTKQDGPEDPTLSEEYVRNIGKVKLWALVIFTALFFAYTYIHFDRQDRRGNTCPTPEERAAAGIIVRTDVPSHRC